MNRKPTDEADIPDDGDTRTRAWYQARTLLALGIGAVLLPVVLFAFQPSFMGAPLTEPPPFALVDLLVPAAFLGMLLGLAWMIRIFRGRATSRRAGATATAEPLPTADRSAGPAGDRGFLGFTGVLPPELFARPFPHPVVRVYDRFPGRDPCILRHPLQRPPDRANESASGA